METIRIYLENMFSGMPKTAQMIELKNDMMVNMEEKYNELKAEGKTENEAIGIVISEFGNIDELMNELGVKNEAEFDEKPVVTLKEVYEYMDIKKSTGFFVGIGVVLCILGAASLILITQLIEDGYIFTQLTTDFKDIIGVIPLLLLVAIGVGIIIYSGMKLERYKYLEEEINLPISVKVSLQQNFDRYTPTYTLTVIVGVILCILSPIILFISSAFNESASVYAVVILLLIVACAVFIFIYFGSIREGYTKLLKIGDYTVQKEKENRVIGAVASIVWPLAVILFLVGGFVYHAWHIAWIVFPITGLLFGMFSAAYSTLKGTNG